MMNTQQSTAFLASCRALTLLGLLCAGVAGPAGAADGALYVWCASCHGDDARGAAEIGAPALAGQLESYLARQMRNFRDGKRGGVEGDRYGAQMAAYAVEIIDDEAVVALSAYLAELPPTYNSDKGSGDPRRGASLYNGNCGACHGGKAEGNDALQSPRLTGLDRSYLERQMRYFRDGQRGGPADDGPGRQMAMMANTLTDPKDIADVLSYISSLAAEAAGTIETDEEGE